MVAVTRSRGRQSAKNPASKFPASKTARSAKTFHSFSKLPPEMRHQVWDIAARQAAPSGKPVCIFQPSKGSSHENPVHDPLVVREVPPELLLTTRESRAIAGKIAERPFDPVTDVLYVSSNIFEDFAWGFLDQRSNKVPSWAAEVRHLAIEMTAFAPYIVLPLALQSLPRLHTLSLVLPAAKGTVNVFDPVAMTKQQRSRPLLRPLTKAETKSMKMKADYMYNTWAADIPVKYETQTSKYIESKLEELEHELKQSSELPPACWDAQEERLTISFEAACFVDL